MPSSYKNTDTSSSIANEFGTWRYFNSNLKKLSGYKAESANIPVPSKMPIEQEVNWVNVVGDAMVASFEGFEAYRDNVAYKKADDYVKKHSMEDYIQAVKANKIPFQDDPIAMQRLKYNYGSLTRNLAKQDFLNRVNRNEFIGKSREQVDAEMYRSYKQSMNSLKDVFPYDAPNDYFFNQGFWEDSEKDRLDVLLQHQKVSNDWNIKEKVRTSLVELSSLIQDPTLTGDELNGFLGDVYNTGLYHSDPLEQHKLMESTMSIITASPNGFRLLNEIKDKQIPGTNTTYGEYYGDASYKLLLAKADNTRTLADTRQWSDFRLRIDELERGLDKQTLKALYSQELIANKNTETERSKYIFSAIQGVERAEAALTKKLQADTETQLKKEQKLRDVTEYLKRTATGVSMEDPVVNNFSTNNLRDAFQRGVDAGLFDQDQQMAIARNTTVPFNSNPARQRFNNTMKSAMSLIGGYMDAYKSNRDGAIPENPPKDIQTIVEIYRKDPVNFRNIVGSDDDGDVYKAQALAFMLDSGRPFAEIITGMMGFEKLKETKEGRVKLNNIRNDVVKSTLRDPGVKSKDTLDYYGKTVLYLLTSNFAITNLNPKDALAKAQEEMNKSLVNFMGATVPISLLNIGASNGIDAMDQVVSNKLKELNLTEKDVIVQFNPIQNALTVSRADTKDLIERYDSKAILEATDKYNDDLSKGVIERLGTGASFNAEEEYVMEEIDY